MTPVFSYFFVFLMLRDFGSILMDGCLVFVFVFLVYFSLCEDCPFLDDLYWDDWLCVINFQLCFM